MRRCCKAVGALVTPLLARSGIYGVCYFRFRHDMRRSKLDWFKHWPQTEWLTAYRANPAVARQIACSWNEDGNKRPPSQLESLTDRHSLPRGLLRLEFPYDLRVFPSSVVEDSETDGGGLSSSDSEEDFTED